MPHIHLSTSADLVENVDIPDILRGLVVELSSHETIESAAIKAYHSLFHTWAMGDGAPVGFVHCTISLMTGRSLELRSKIADAMYDRLCALFAESLDTGEVKPTLEVREMEKSTYRRM